MDSSVDIPSHFDTVIAALDYRLADLKSRFKHVQADFTYRYVINTIPISHSEYAQYISQFSFDVDYDRHYFNRSIGALMELMGKLEINYSFITTMSGLFETIEELVVTRKIVIDELTRYKEELKAPDVVSIHFEKCTKITRLVNGRDVSVMIHHPGGFLQHTYDTVMEPGIFEAKIRYSTALEDKQ